MQQRRVRLGDILDDYCPRERRVTNHAVVAMIEETVRLTRCTTCDAEHDYKEARVPAPRRRQPAGLGGAGGAVAPRPRPAAAIDPAPSDLEAPDFADLPDDEPEALPVAAAESSLSEETSLEAADTEEADGTEARDDRDEWPVHRPLIRATLPRPEGQTPERKAPDFTIHRVEQRRNGQRNRGGRPGRPGGQPSQGQPMRFGGQRHGQGQGHGRPGGSRPGSGHGTGGQPPRSGNRQGQAGGGRPNQGRKRGR